MFNKTAVGVYQGAVAKGIDNIRQQAVNLSTESVGVVDKAAEEMGNTFNGLIERIKGKWDNIKTTIGESLMDGAKEGARYLLDELNNIDVDELSELISNMVKPIFDIFSMLIDLLNTTIIPLLNDIFIKIQPIIQLISEIFQTIIPIIGNILSKLTPLISIVGSIFNTIWNAISPLINTLLNELVPLIETIVNLVEILWAVLQPIVDIVITMVSDFLSPIIESLLPALTEIINIINEILSPLFEIIAEILAELKPFLEFTSSILGGAIATAIKVISVLLKPILEAIKFIVNLLKSLWDMIKKIGESIKNALGKVWEGIKVKVTDFFNFFANIGKQAFNFVDSALGTVFGEERWNSIKANITRVFQWIGDTFKKVADWIYDKIRWLIDPIMKLLGLEKEETEILQEQVLIQEEVKTTINPEIDNHRINEISDVINNNLEGQIEIVPELNTEVIQEEFNTLYKEIENKMNLNLKWAEYEEESAIKINQIKLEGLTELINLKQQEIETLGTNIERETELVDLLIKRKEILNEINPENFLQQFSDNLTEQYKIMEKDIEKLVNLEDKIVEKRQSIYDKQTKEIEKYQDNVIKAQEKISDYEEKWSEKLQKDIDKLQEKIDNTISKISEKQSEIDEKMKVKGTILRSDILLDDNFSDYSTLDNIKDQVFDGFRSTEETLQESLRWIEKVYPDEVNKIYQKIEQTVTEERNKLLGNYLTDEELFASSMLEDPMDAIREKYSEKPEILDSILSEIQEKTDEVKLNMMEEILSNIQIIDDSSIQSMNNELTNLQDEMEELRRQDIRNDKQWQKLNETLSETEDLLNKTASPEYIESLMEQDKNLQELISTYEELRGELNFIQTADLTNSDNLQDSTERLREYKKSLQTMLENKLIDETLLNDNEDLMNRFRELFNNQIQSLGDTGLYELENQISNINKDFKEVIDYINDNPELTFTAYAEVIGTEDLERFGSALDNINIDELSEDLQIALSDGNIFNDFYENLKNRVQTGSISGIEAAEIYNQFSNDIQAAVEDGTLNGVKMQEIWDYYSDQVQTTTGSVEVILELSDNAYENLRNSIENMDPLTIPVEIDREAIAKDMSFVNEMFTAGVDDLRSLERNLEDVYGGDIISMIENEVDNKLNKWDSMDYVQALNESSVWQYTMMSFIQSMIDQGLISQMEGENLVDLLLEKMGDWAGIGYTGGAISDLSPNPSPYAPNSFDDRMIFANKDEILLNRDISNHFRDELLYLNKFGELPLWSSLFIQEKFIPNFDIADYKNNLNKNLIDSKSNKSIYQLIEKENNSNNKIEVLIKNENEKKQKNAKNINRPIIFNFNGRKSNLKLTKEEVVVMERIADRIANKNIKESLSEFWEY